MEVLCSLLDEALRFNVQSAMLSLFLYQCTGASAHVVAAPPIWVLERESHKAVAPDNP